MKKAKLTKQKEEKKNTKNTKNNHEIKHKVLGFIISIIVILAILVGFYFLTEKILKNRKTEDEKKEEAELVDVRKLNDINYSDVEKMVAKTYFLLFDKGDDKNNSTYDFYINLLKYNGFNIEFYYIDLSKEENKSVLGKKESLKSLKDIKVKDTTLVFVNNGDIAETYVGSEKILGYFGQFFTAEDSNSNSNSNSDSNKSNSNKSNSNKSNSNKNK